MGHEYKILTNLSERQKIEISDILEHLPIFYKKYAIDNKENLDFKHVENKGSLPNFTITFETDGIYFCKYDSPDLWKDLNKLKNYLEFEKINFSVIDYFN